MNWFKKHTHITLLALMATVFMTYLYVTDEKVEHDYITVEQGETLWSLAEHYRGKMDAQQWIADVKAHNNLLNSTIKAGSELFVPIERNSVYVTLKESQQNPVEVASDYK